MNVAVMGCVVNGPGESRHANIGISLPGSGEAPVSPVFIDGKKWGSLKGPKMSEEFHSLIEEYVQKKLPKCEGTIMAIEKIQAIRGMSDMLPEDAPSLALL